MDKSDPLQQSNYADQVRDQLGKHTLWLNADNFEEMVKASWEAIDPTIQDTLQGITVQGIPEENLDLWRAMCAAALVVVEWRMGGRVRP